MHVWFHQISNSAYFMKESKAYVICVFTSLHCTSLHTSHPTNLVGKFDVRTIYYLKRLICSLLLLLEVNK